MDHPGLGARDLTFLVVSAAAPLMIMAGVAPFAILAGGIGAPAAYLVAGLVLGVFAVGFTTMSRHVEGGGALYTYVARGLGRPAGIAAALVSLVSYNAVQIGLYGLLGVTAHDSVRAATGLDLPWPLYAFAGMLLVWYGGLRGISFGAKLLTVMLVLETAMLLLVSLGVVWHGGAAGLHVDSFAPSHVLTTATGSLLPFAFAAFIGFESAVVYRAEARDPRRSIPRATYTALAFLAVLYGFVSWALIQAFGSDGVVDAARDDPAGLMFAVTDRYVGPWATGLLHLLIVSGVLASLLAFHTAVNRYTVTLAEEGLLPQRLTATLPTTGAPHVAGAAQTALAALVVGGFAVTGADPYFQLLIWVNTPGVLGVVVLLAAVAVAVPVYFRRTPHNEGPWRTIIAPLLAVLGTGGALYLMLTKITLLTNASPAANAVMVCAVPAMILVGFGVAWWLRRNRPEVYRRFGTVPEVAHALR